MAFPPLPDVKAPIVDANGAPTAEFYRWLLAVHRIKLGDIRDVDLSTPAGDTEQLSYSSSTNKWSGGTA